MNRQTIRQAVVTAIAGAVALGAVTSSWAAPVSSSTTIVKESAPPSVSDVRYRGGGRYYRNNSAGVALGVLGIVGAVAGAAAYGNGYYGGGPGYYRQGYYGGPQGYYGAPNGGYAYEPTYVVPSRRYYGGSDCAVEGAYRPDYSHC